MKFVEQCSFAGNCQRRIRISIEENCESAKGNWQTFLFDQPAGLHQSPFIVLRKASFAERKFLQWNPSPLECDLRFVATKLCKCAPQRFGARSEEHTSELQSLTNLVCRLLLE